MLSFNQFFLSVSPFAFHFLALARTSFCKWWIPGGLPLLGGLEKTHEGRALYLKDSTLTLVCWRERGKYHPAQPQSPPHQYFHKLLRFSSENHSLSLGKPVLLHRFSDYLLSDRYAGATLIPGFSLLLPVKHRIPPPGGPETSRKIWVWKSHLSHMEIKPYPFS